MIAMLIAGLARAAVGLGLASRWYVYPPIALAIAYFALGVSIWTPIIATVAALNVGLGWTDWDNRLHQAIRYSVLPFVLIIPALIISHNFSPLLWAALCAIVGAIEIDIRRGLEPFGFTIFGRDISSAQYAEFVIGAACIGGMILVRV